MTNLFEQLRKQQDNLGCNPVNYGLNSLRNQIKIPSVTSLDTQTFLEYILLSLCKTFIESLPWSRGEHV